MRPGARLASLIAAILLAAIWLPASAQAPAATPLVTAIDDVVAKTMQAQKVPGVSLAVVKDGQVLVAKGYGFADVATSTKATEQTVYQLASVTKQFTAAAVLMLVDEGKLSLDAKITDVLPGLPAAWSPVTVRHLLTHTSGIKSYTDVYREQKIPDDRAFTHEQILALVKDAPLKAAPGTRFAYCNTGYFLLGMIVEKVSGQSYPAFVTKRIFAPLGMTSSGYDDYADARPTRAKGYETKAGQTAAAPHTHPSQPFAAGALVSTAADLVKWDAALTARKLLSAASYDAMWTAAKANDGTNIPYGFGWQVDTFRGHKRIAHGGGITGFSTFITRLPDDEVTVIVLVNQSGGVAGQLANAIAGIVVPGLKPTVMHDEDPKLTGTLKQVLTAFAAGSADAALLTPEFAAFLLPDKVRTGPQMVGRFGPLNAFDLIELTTRNGGRVRVYRAVFGTTSLRATFAVTGDGKVAGLNLAPEP
jgi:CubicO group peptidase (beta-lactamase class C family)